MAIWGNKDTKALTGSGSVTATNASATVTGVGTAFSTELETGNTILITDVPYKVVAIASDTSLTINPVYAGVTGSDKVVSANESPAYTPVAELSTVYGVDAAEAKAGGAQLLGIVVTGGGTDYLEVPAVTISGGGGTGATGTATISGGAVTAIALGGTVTSYETIPTVTVDKARRSVTGGLSSDSVTNNNFTYVGHGLSNGETVTYVGDGITAGITTATSYYVVNTAADTFQLSATLGGAAIDFTDDVDAGDYFIVDGATAATAVVEKGVGSGDGVSSAIAHVGWVKKKVGTGGRAGRIEYETLVAIDITGDASDDAAFPDS